MQRSRFVSRATMILATMVGLSLIALSMNSSQALVLDRPKAKGVGNDPIKYKFNLDPGEGLQFSFVSSNATVEAVFIDIRASNRSVVSTSTFTVNQTTYIKTYGFAWTCNITINATASYTGSRIDFYAKYTFIKTSGRIMSYIVAAAAATIGVVFVYLLVKKKTKEASK
nr:hypothetical protein [Candidatus Sigynarchaeota archaeon]